MTTSQQSRSESLPLEEKTVADYLRDNPDFFLNNTSLLATLQVPHGVDGAVSLVEHQVKVLRDQNRQLKRKLMDLVHVARDNNRLNERMHQLTLGLISSSSLEALLDTLREHLQGEFSADTVTIRLAGLPEARARECAIDIFSGNDPQLKHFESFYKACRPPTWVNCSTSCSCSTWTWMPEPAAGLADIHDKPLLLAATPRNGAGHPARHA
jgi:hypothetical protein